MAKAQNYIKDWRTSKGLNQSELAAALKDAGLNLTAGSLSRLESGKNSYTAKTLEKIASVLGCKPWQLIQGPPNQHDSDHKAAIVYFMTYRIVTQHIAQGNLDELAKFNDSELDEYWYQMADLMDLGLSLLRKGVSLSEIEPALAALSAKPPRPKGPTETY